MSYGEFQHYTAFLELTASCRVYETAAVSLRLSQEDLSQFRCDLAMSLPGAGQGQSQ